MKTNVDVAIVMGSDSDLPIMKDAAKILKEFGISYEVKVLSGPFAGRTGKVESIDRDKETAIVLVEFLGNSTPMEVELVQLEKAEL